MKPVATPRIGADHHNDTDEHIEVTTSVSSRTDD
jgi:hypothetical protein